MRNRKRKQHKQRVAALLVLVCTSPCSIPTCQEPSISNGIYAGVHDGPIFQKGETIHAICEPGYRLEGPIFRYCVGENEWLGSEPLCVRGKY